MRARMLLLVLAIVLVGAFAYQNWSQITTPSTLTFGVLEAAAPLGLILLTLLGITLLVALASTASMRTRSLVESRHHAKELQVQRDLAEKAEASRFTDLRQVLDTHLRESRQRETVLNAEMERAMAQHQRELRNQLEQMYHLLTSRLSELERRIDHRPGRVEHVETVQPVRTETLHPHASSTGRERV